LSRARRGRGSIGGWLWLGQASGGADHLNRG
jgi:hypothetical protein